MSYLTANPNPDSDNYRAYKQGWRDGLRALTGVKAPYKDPDRNTWQATGFRFGYYLEIMDEQEIDRAWQWSIQELRREGYIDVWKYYDEGAQESEVEIIAAPRAHASSPVPTFLSHRPPVITVRPIRKSRRLFWIIVGISASLVLALIILGFSKYYFGSSQSKSDAPSKKVNNSNQNRPLNRTQNVNRK